MALLYHRGLRGPKSRELSVMPLRIGTAVAILRTAFGITRGDIHRCCLATAIAGQYPESLAPWHLFVFHWTPDMFPATAG